jgi:hypothetical protein
MRKFVLVLFAGFFLLQACSAFETAVPSPTRKPTLTFTATIAPTMTITPTITPSPTIVKIPTVDYNATSTPPAFTYIIPSPGDVEGGAMPVPTETPSSPGAGFEWVKVAGTQVYWGICTPNKLKVTAQVSEPKDVYSVVLFVRLRNLKAQIFSPWNKGTGMHAMGNDGLWTQDLYASSVNGHVAFRRGWVWYQLVATGKDNLEVGRTRIFMDSIRLEPCMCMTPPCGPKD